MRYRQIEAFRSVMVRGTTTGAAQALYVTQPAISRLIADLEAELGFKLFERIKKRLHPTPDGIQFYRGVEQFYSGIDGLEQLAERIRSQHFADIKLSATPALSTFIFPRAIRAFRTLFPRVNLHVESYPSSEIAARLRTHTTHIAVTQAFPEIPGITQVHLIEAPHVCAMHESHRLASKQVVTPEDLRGENVLSILPTGLSNWNSINQTLEAAGVAYDSDIGIQNSHTGYSLIAENLAIGVIEPFASHAWRKNGVVIRSFVPEITFRYVLAFSQLMHQTKPMKALGKIIADSFGTYLDNPD